jgi:hypothetical protein
MIRNENEICFGNELGYSSMQNTVMVMNNGMYCDYIKLDKFEGCG